MTLEFVIQRKNLETKEIDYAFESDEAFETNAWRKKEGILIFCSAHRLQFV